MGILIGLLPVLACGIGMVLCMRMMTGKKQEPPHQQSESAEPEPGA